MASNVENDLPSRMHLPDWSVQVLAEKQDSVIPPLYVQDFSDTFPVAIVGDGSSVDHEVPVIDFMRIQEGDPRELATFFKAVDKWGFFQLVNHQLTPGMLSHALDLCKNFFQLPFSEKVHYHAADPNKPTLGYGRTMMLTETAKADWADTLVLGADELVSSKQKVVDLSKWNQLPEAYREGISTFARQTHSLGLKLLSLLTNSLGIEPIEVSYGDTGVLLSTSIYPPCSHPELVVGLRAHSNYMTLLVQDKPGLQVLKDGCWHTVKAIHEAIVVNLGDQLEILTNGKCKSVVHRVMVSDQFTRYSLGCFLRPMADATIGPDPKLVDDQHPALYKPMKYGNYYAASEDTISRRNEESILSAGELKSSLKIAPP